MPFLWFSVGSFYRVVDSWHSGLGRGVAEGRPGCSSRAVLPPPRPLLARGGDVVRVFVHETHELFPEDLHLGLAVVLPPLFALVRGHAMRQVLMLHVDVSLVHDLPLTALAAQELHGD